MCRAALLFLLCTPAFSLAALDALQYARSRQVHEDFLLRWNIANGKIQIGIEVTAAGWVGFGISEAGGMKGADILYFEAATGELVDAHALEYAKPVVDACQDWELISSAQEGGKIILEAERTLATDDNEDWELIDDQDTPQGHAFIAAWGDSAEISFHGSRRASGRVILFGDTPVDKFKDLVQGEGIESSDLLHDNNPIPQKETTYDDYCVNIQSALGFDDAAAAIPRHIVAYEAVLDDRTAPYVHHFIVYGFSSESCDWGDGGLVMGWAPGRNENMLPPEAGLRILGSDGYRSLMIQTHYNNPAIVEGLMDSSGLRIHHTRNLRQYDMGVIQLGDPLLYLAIVNREVAPGWSRHSFSCDGLTSDFDDEEVTVFSRFLHMHQTGERMEVQQIRGGETVRRDSVEVYDFAQSGGHDPLSTGAGFKVRKGDAFRVDCYYHAKDEAVMFGLGSSEEMCIDYMYYYPLQRTLSKRNGGSCAVALSDGKYLGDAQFETVRGTGRVFGLACDGSDGLVIPGDTPTPTTSAAARVRGVVGGAGAVLGWVVLVIGTIHAVQ